jgi:sec-independent protein translocase protein TatA
MLPAEGRTVPWATGRPKEGHVVFAEILGPDLLVIVLIVVVLFGGSQIPKLARSVGSARREFEAGLRDDHAEPGPPPQTHVLTRTEVDELLRPPRGQSAGSD